MVDRDIKKTILKNSKIISPNYYYMRKNNDNYIIFASIQCIKEIILGISDTKKKGSRFAGAIGHVFVCVKLYTIY